MFNGIIIIGFISNNIIKLKLSAFPQPNNGCSAIAAAVVKNNGSYIIWRWHFNDCLRRSLGDNKKNTEENVKCLHVLKYKFKDTEKVISIMLCRFLTNKAGKLIVHSLGSVGLKCINLHEF